MGKIVDASAPTIRLDAALSVPTMPHLHYAPNFMPDALPIATLPIYTGLGQASNMLDCIPGGLVIYNKQGKQYGSGIPATLVEMTGATN